MSMPTGTFTTDPPSSAKASRPNRAIDYSRTITSKTRGSGGGSQKTQLSVAGPLVGRVRYRGSFVEVEEDG